MNKTDRAFLSKQLLNNTTIVDILLKTFPNTFLQDQKQLGKTDLPSFFLSRSSKISQEFGSGLALLTHAPKLCHRHTHPLTHQYKQHGLHTGQDF